MTNETFTVEAIKNVPALPSAGGGVISPNPSHIAKKCVRIACKLVGLQVSPAGSDSLPEWSKGVDSSSTSVNCVGSKIPQLSFLFASGLL